MVELRDTFRTLGDDPGVRVAVFTGHGEKAFMAGVDLKTFDTDDTEADPDDPGRLPREALEAVYDCAVPVIAAVNGPALGAGLAYAAVCDLILAADHATFGTTEINVGLLGRQRAPEPAAGPTQGPGAVPDRRPGHSRGAVPPGRGQPGRAARPAGVDGGRAGRLPRGQESRWPCAWPRRR